MHKVGQCEFEIFPRGPNKSQNYLCLKVEERGIELFREKIGSHRYLKKIQLKVSFILVNNRIKKVIHQLIPLKNNKMLEKSISSDKRLKSNLQDMLKDDLDFTWKRYKNRLIICVCNSKNLRLRFERKDNTLSIENIDVSKIPKLLIEKITRCSVSFFCKLNDGRSRYFIFVFKRLKNGKHVLFLVSKLSENDLRTLKNQKVKNKLILFWSFTSDSSTSHDKNRLKKITITEDDTRVTSLDQIPSYRPFHLYNKDKSSTADIVLFEQMAKTFDPKIITLLNRHKKELDVYFAFEYTLYKEKSSLRNQINIIKTTKIMNFSTKRSGEKQIIIMKLEVEQVSEKQAYDALQSNDFRLGVRIRKQENKSNIPIRFFNRLRMIDVHFRDETAYANYSYNLTGPNEAHEEKDEVDNFDFNTKQPFLNSQNEDSDENTEKASESWVVKNKSILIGSSLFLVAAGITIGSVMFFT